MRHLEKLERSCGSVAIHHTYLTLSEFYFTLLLELAMNEYIFVRIVMKFIAPGQDSKRAPFAIP